MIFIVFPHTDNNSGLFWISFSEARVYGLLFFFLQIFSNV